MRKDSKKKLKNLLKTQKTPYKNSIPSTKIKEHQSQEKFKDNFVKDFLN